MTALCICRRRTLHETLRVHFNGQDNLVVLAFDADDQGVALRWGRAGAKFPQYGVLDIDRCVRNRCFG